MPQFGLSIATLDRQNSIRECDSKTDDRVKILCEMIEKVPLLKIVSFPDETNILF